MAKPSEVKLIVLATDPGGSEVAFEASGWAAAYRLMGRISGYPNRSYGWRYLRTVRLINQGEVRP